jgi:hypothetical protein
MSGIFCHEDIAVDLNTHLCCRRLLGDYIQLAFGSPIISGKAEQLEEERTSAGIGWVRSYFLVELLNGSREMSGIEKLFGLHGGPLSSK